MKFPGRSDASRTVLIMLLGIAFFELGAAGKFSQLWSLAFTGHSGSPTSDSAAGALHPGASASAGATSQDSTGASRPGVLH